MHSLASPDKPVTIPQHTVQLNGGIVNSQFVAYPSANKNVLVLGLTVRHHPATHDPGSPAPRVYHAKTATLL